MWDKVKSLASVNKTLAFVTFSNLTNSVIAIVSGLIIARWLLPEELGVFNAFSIFTSYIVLAQIGIPSGLSRELPFYFGRNDPDKAIEFASTSKYFLITISVIVFCFCALTFIYFFILQNYSYAVGALVIGATSFQGIYVTKFLKVLYRSENHFFSLAKIDLINSVINLASLVLVYYFLFYGLCMRAILLVFVDWYFSDRWKPVTAKACFNWSNFKALLRVGMPIYFVSNIYGLWPTFQRTLVLSFLGVEGLGLYALANIVQSMLSTFNNTISSMSFPLMSKAYGEGKKLKEIMLIPFNSFLISLVVYTIVLFVGWPTLPYVVEWLLPNYIEGVAAAQWMFLVALVSSFSVFSNVFMVIKKNHHRLVGFVAGILAWFLYLGVHSIEEIGDMIVFSQAILIGIVVITISDFTFYFLYLKRESSNLTVRT